MSFSADLLDGLDLLGKRTTGVLKSTEGIADLLKNIAKVEREYGKTLLKLAQSERKEFSKAEAMRKEVATTYNCWDTILGEMEKVGEHHSQVADKIENELVKDIGNYLKEKTKSKKKLDGDGERIRKDWKTAKENLEKSRSKYVTLSKDHDKAEAEHTKGKGDMQMKPAALAKLAAKASQAQEKATAADSEYQSTLQLTNQKQSEFYNSLQPSLLQEFQSWEEDRISFMKTIAEKFSSLQSEHPTFYSTISNNINTIANAITVESDIQAFVKDNATGVTVPGDIQYQSYEVEAPLSPGAPPKAPKPTTKPGAKKPGKYNPGGGSDSINKEWGLTSADSHLSAEEKHSKLVGQLDEIDKELTKETKTKDGLDNLVRFYASDPVAQKKAEDQVKESENRIHQLTDIRHNVQSQLDNLASGGSGGGGHSKARGLYDYNATAETELSFKQGDILTVTEQDDSGWWYCELNGRQGFVPNNYVELI